MPMRVKSRPLSQVDAGLRTPSPLGARWISELPDVEKDDSFRVVVKKISEYIADAITLPSTFDQLRTTSAGDSLRLLVEHLSETCENPAIVNALLALKWHYGAVVDDKSLNEARANACEIVAWRFLTHLSEREAVDFCLYEIPDPDDVSQGHGRYRDEEDGPGQPSPQPAEATPAWSPSHPRRTAATTGSSKRYQLLMSLSRLTMSMGQDGDEEEEEDDPTAPFTNLNALEIAAIADAKRFLSQHVVQKIVTGIWNGDIIFWDSLSVHSTKQPRFYNPRTTDPFSRLRIPKYLKSFEILFFASFLFLYYYVLVARNPEKISVMEVLLYIWFAAFFYDELSEWLDAGSIFYAADIWNLFDMIMIAIGIAFVCVRTIGLSRHDAYLIGLSFDILALEALFMVPRVCSVLSLSPYWGTLIPCLKEMGKDFIKFMVLVIIVYLGFLTTFSLVGRDIFTFGHMSMILLKIFFGSSYVGFEIMDEIDPVFGPPLMIIFVTLSSILLMGSLTGMLSNSFSRVITHAREEYLYVYSVYVLEASTSNRLTHFYPPFNLLALVIFRPLRLFLPSDDKFRAARIALLKATHLPIVLVIQLYEYVYVKFDKTDRYAGFKGPRQQPALGTAQPGYSAGSLQTTPRRPRPSRPAVVARPSSSSMPDLRPRTPARARQTFSATAAATHVAAAQLAAEPNEDDGVGEPPVPTDVEVHIADLSKKIDRLTELVIALQTQQTGDVSVTPVL